MPGLEGGEVKTWVEIDIDGEGADRLEELFKLRVDLYSGTVLFAAYLAADIGAILADKKEELNRDNEGQKQAEGKGERFCFRLAGIGDKNGGAGDEGQGDRQPILELEMNPKSEIKGEG